MMKLAISRTGDTAGLARSIRIMRGEEELTRLKVGERKEVEIPPGPTEISARMNWYHSAPLRFEAIDDATANISVKLQFRSIWKLFSGKDAVYLSLDRPSS
jgi:hypothetical protein